MEVILLSGMFYIVLILGIIAFIRIFFNRFTKSTKEKIQELESKIKVLEDEIKNK